MAKQKKQSQPVPRQKKQGEPPLLEEKKTFLFKAGSFMGGLIPRSLGHDLKAFGHNALFTVPAIIVASGVLVGVDMLMHGRMMPRTTMNGTEVGLVYAEEAANTLRQSVETYLQTPLLIAVNGTEARITPEELGVSFSLNQSLRDLPAYDLRKDSVVTLALATLFEKEARPSLSLDSEKALDVIEQKLDLKKFRAQDAHITLDGKGNPAIIQETDGKMIDEKELMIGLKQSIRTMSPLKISLELLDERPVVTAQDLEPQKQKVAEALKTPVTLLHAGRQWKFEPSKHADAVTFTQNPTVTLKNINWTLPIVLNEQTIAHAGEKAVVAANPSMAVDEEKIHQYLQEEIIAKIDSPTSDVKIYTDENKKIVIEGKGQNGIKVSSQALVESLGLALNNSIKRLQVPALEEKAHVAVSDDLQDLGIKNLIATGHSAFAGSHKGRITNINVGISKYNGLLVMPGETFSFNEHLGEVDAANGFVPELVIKAEGTVPEYGGGLCQVSSTLYRAALMAGFPIVERSPHSYAVSYYAQVLGYGLDATIYPGVHDIKFVNDSPGAIVMQAYTEGDQAYYKFYGTDDGRKVRLEGPYQGNYRSPGPTQVVETDKLPPGARKQVEINHTGFDVTWYRYIVKNNEEMKETIFSRYKAIPAKVMVGRGATAQASVPST